MPATAVREAACEAGGGEAKRAAARPIHAAVTGFGQLAGSGMATPAAVLAVQRHAGNRAASALVRRRSSPARRPSAPDVVRRDLDEGVDKSAGGLDAVSGQVSNFSGMGGITQMPDANGNLQNGYKLGNNSSSGATGGVVGAIGSGLAGTVSMITKARTAEQARQTAKTEAAAGREGEATHHDAIRTHRTARTDAVAAAGNVSSQGLSATSGFSQIAANAGSTSHFASLNNLLGGIGSIIALPFTALATARTAWKGKKQYDRVQALRARILDPATPEATAKRALDDHEALGPELVRLAAEARSAAEPFESTVRTLTSKGKPIPGEVSRGLAANRRIVADADAAVVAWGVEKERLTLAKEAATASVRQAADDMRSRADTETESPADIRAYALRKNANGVRKKFFSFVGGLLGIGGGIAGTIASFAAIGATTVVATAAMATPVGWALCGAAALIGLSVAGYAFWKWASKRYDRARAAGDSRAKAFFSAINPFAKSQGQSRRERLASRLYDYAVGQVGGAAVSADAQKEARETIADLGLNFDTMKMDSAGNKDAAIRLIAAKMGS